MSERSSFPGSRRIASARRDTEIRCVVGGDGPPVLLLHGYPQTHAMWHRVAPALARHYTVVCADLRGYGDSGKPASDDDARRVFEARDGADMVELMRDLGHRAFRLVGHDRGGRVAHRLCLDHPDAVSQLAVLDISPTRTMYAHTDQAFATAYYHWFFLIQPFDLPERLIGADPGVLPASQAGRLGHRACAFRPARARRIRALLQRSGDDPCDAARTTAPRRRSTSSTMRASEAQKIACPLLVLWGERGVVHRFFKPLDDWRAVAVDVRGRSLPCGHYLAEEVPDETLRELIAFFAT